MTYPVISTPSAPDSILDSPTSTIGIGSGNESISRTLSIRSESSTASPQRKAPLRLLTDPTSYHTTEDLQVKITKRIIVCCDGTWQDGFSTQKSKFTNVLRLARCINHQDDRDTRKPPIPQVLFYQSGIGTECNSYQRVFDGITGNSLGTKVQEAYGFIAHNYHPGDEIFLFGFSRGAYTARMVAAFIGEIGILDRTDMDDFADIFLDYQQFNNRTSTTGKEVTKHKWHQHIARGKARADTDRDTFTVKCVGVFDTVGSIGLPEEVTVGAGKAHMIFEFPDNYLCEHIKYAYQALALHETRKAFDCIKFEQKPRGKQKGQVLKQCWFAGSHSDIGGSYKYHDLADITLAWMAAHVESILSLDVQFLSKIPDPVAEWGMQVPHDSASGHFIMADKIQRSIPTKVNEETQEYIHPSVILRKGGHSKLNTLAALPYELNKLVMEHPEIVSHLLPLEEQFRNNWPFVVNSPVACDYANCLETQTNQENQMHLEDRVEIEKQIQVNEVQVKRVQVQVQNQDGIINTITRTTSRIYNQLFGVFHPGNVVKISEEAKTVEVNRLDGNTVRRRSMIFRSLRGRSDLLRKHSRRKDGQEQYSSVEVVVNPQNVARSVAVQ